MAVVQRLSRPATASKPFDYSTPYDAACLVAEVSAGTFCWKNKVKSGQVRALWENLAAFIVATLQRQKGVLLPNLGSFKVGPVVGESAKKIRPAFCLLEGRYGGVSQERTRYAVGEWGGGACQGLRAAHASAHAMQARQLRGRTARSPAATGAAARWCTQLAAPPSPARARTAPAARPGGRSPVIQPNYGLLSTQAGIHRGATQRLVGELLQRLGVHVLSGRTIKVRAHAHATAPAAACTPAAAAPPLQPHASRRAAPCGAHLRLPSAPACAPCRPIQHSATSLALASCPPTRRAAWSSSSTRCSWSSSRRSCTQT